MKKNFVILLTMTLLIAGILSGCGHEHTWREATCTEPRTCTECGDTEGNPLGHTWIEATCVSPKTCSVCGETEGSTIEHSWIDATCTSPKTCSVCGETEGSTIEHSWIDATCTSPKTCSVCGETEGDVTEHVLNSDGKCTVCGSQIGSALSKLNYKNYLNIKSSFRVGFSMADAVFTIQPVVDGTFGKAIVTIQYLDINQKETHINIILDSSGYGSGSVPGRSYSSTPNFSVSDVSGYVIE